MPTLLNPYLNFDGRADEAIRFYQHVLGGRLELTTYAEGGMSHGPDDANRVMHAQLTAQNGMTLMASDTPPGMPSGSGSAIAISLSGEDEAELRGYWTRLSDGASVLLPLERAPWGDIFGILTDRFGVQWMVDIGPAH
ncbi:PhnB protein [Devosia enhydra]|uniref:PhnB protein n=1 Tax=Devosia enhydra TaxID=665118 RepID=A0A1K2HYA8_9HYPH|nr:VOC family protein [Devosia enhydra]SFZ84912.1 PhnB protein [Devosia enhydra]